LRGPWNSIRCRHSTHDLGWIFNQARRWDQAIEQFRRVLEMEPEFSNARRGVGLCLCQQGMFEQAFEQIQKELELTGGGPRRRIWDGPMR
jgi:Flp pilus assembly protein TadD